MNDFATEPVVSMFKDAASQSFEGLVWVFRIRSFSVRASRHP